ncbi:hypothetical protein T265_11217 [Opisthorchis viverrini]|uniref:Uncharacterized protein n=1 Tax=Opisthorchis viverrini TaxID=6198 RepID=A0A074ZAE5_OPIVI|nr:hypothetical protein T265_11217 [Opisthorchis viverrini]KER20180.1 hypothetical protein T265_11217 [Opisthorchis viverrini]
MKASEDETTVVTVEEGPKRIFETEESQMVTRYFGFAWLADMDEFTTGTQNLKPIVLHDKALPDATNMDITVVNVLTAIRADGLFRPVLLTT